MHYGIYNGIAAVRSHEKWALVTTKGENITDFIFDRIDWMDNFERAQFAYAERNGKAGYVNAYGREITPFIYDKITPNERYSGMFGNPLVVKMIQPVKIRNKYGFIDTTGKVITKVKYDMVKFSGSRGATVCINGQWGFIDNRGREIIRPTYGKDFYFLYGYACVSDGLHEGLIDSTGKVIIPVEYDRVGIWRSKALITVKQNGKYGLFDAHGKQVTAIKYDDIDVDEPLIQVEQDGKVGLLDQAGKEIVAPQYSSINEFNGPYAVVSKNGKQGAIDQSGNIILPLEYQLQLYSFSYGLNGYKGNGKIGIINVAGKQLTGPEFDDLSVVTSHHDQYPMFRVMKDSLWALMDTTGTVLTPFKYTEIGWASDDLIKVKVNDKMALVDRAGNEIIPPKYDVFFGWGELYRVKANGKWGYLGRYKKEYWDN